MNQEERVLRHLRQSGSLTAKEASEQLGIMQLPARILHLRRLGHLIEMETVQAQNRYGNPIRYGVYRLREEAWTAGSHRAMADPDVQTYDQYRERAAEYAQLELIAEESGRMRI